MRTDNHYEQMMELPSDDQKTNESNKHAESELHLQIYEL